MCPKLEELRDLNRDVAGPVKLKVTKKMCRSGGALPIDRQSKVKTESNLCDLGDRLSRKT